MRKDNYQDFQGNDQYEGFCVDMLRELADILKFSFKIKLVDDGLYGAPEPNGSWTGMVGELINRVSTLLLPAGSTHKKSEKKNKPQKVKTQRIVPASPCLHERRALTVKQTLGCSLPCLKLPSKGSSPLI